MFDNTVTANNFKIADAALSKKYSLSHSLDNTDTETVQPLQIFNPNQFMLIGQWYKIQHRWASSLRSRWANETGSCCKCTWVSGMLYWSHQASIHRCIQISSLSTNWPHLLISSLVPTLKLSSLHANYHYLALRQKPSNSFILAVSQNTSPKVFGKG